MARSRRSSTTTSSYGSSWSSPPRLPALRALEQARALIKAIEDRRRWSPLGFASPAGAKSRMSRRLTVSGANSTARLTPPSGLSFSVPRDVAVCVRRKERREVIFAQRKAGKGARSPRRRSKFSDIGC